MPLSYSVKNYSQGRPVIPNFVDFFRTRATFSVTAAAMALVIPLATLGHGSARDKTPVTT